MNILMVCTVFWPSTIYGGPSSVALKQAVGLVDAGHNVTVVTTDLLSFRPPQRSTAPVQTVHGVTVRYFPAAYLRSAFPLVRSADMEKWLGEHCTEYDAVHIHFAREWIPLRAAMISLRARVPTYLQTHGMLNRRDGVRTFLDLVFVRRVLEGASGVFVLQAHETAIVREVAPNARLITMPNGIQIDPDLPRWSSVSLSSRTVLFLARLHPRKRVMDLIGAAKILRDEGFNYRYRIVGPDGGDLQKAIRAVEDNHLKDIVEFVGPLASERVPDEMSRAGLYVLPSVDEPFPMSVLEALAVGVPTIVTTGIHIRQLLEAAEAAVITEPGPCHIAQAIRCLFEDPNLAQQVAERGRKLVESNLQLEVLLQRLVQVYTGITSVDEDGKEW